MMTRKRRRSRILALLPAAAGALLALSPGSASATLPPPDDSPGDDVPVEDEVQSFRAFILFFRVHCVSEGDSCVYGPPPS